LTEPLIADTGGLLRALARRPNGRPTWPKYETALRRASAVIVPDLEDFGPLRIGPRYQRALTIVP
jgi:hypothetical protein